MLKFDHIGTDKRNQVIIPANITSDNFVNELNMLWEWSWGPASEPEDKRLIRFFGLTLVNRYYHIDWPSNVPK